MSWPLQWHGAAWTFLALGVLITPLDHEDVVCVRFWPEVRYGNLGYDHIVHVYNSCETRVRCSVSSDVNPEAVEVLVPTNEHREVVLNRGTPAREFTPNVECRFVRRGVKDR